MGRGRRSRQYSPSAQFPLSCHVAPAAQGQGRWLAGAGGATRPVPAGQQLGATAAPSALAGRLAQRHLQICRRRLHRLLLDLRATVPSTELVTS